MQTCSRIERCFTKESKGRLISFMTAGDPDKETCLSILKGLPEVGVDCIELGMPFSDPMADGPVIQESSQRALRAGGCMRQTFSLVSRFRRDNSETPLILMGYYNPIYRYGVERFLKRAVDTGVDGLIIVDLPPEADKEVYLPAQEVGIDCIRLVAPTTSNQRLSQILRHTTGFIYYISITGVTGTTSATTTVIKEEVLRLRRHTTLPIVVGFGIRTAQQVHELKDVVDGVVIGSAIVEQIAMAVDSEGQEVKEVSERVLRFVAGLKGKE